jgi:hypothetical protein
LTNKNDTYIATTGSKPDARMAKRAYKVEGTRHTVKTAYMQPMTTMIARLMHPPQLRLHSPLHQSQWSCPRFHSDEKETYYPCPPQACITYAVALNDPTYAPAPSTCDPYKEGKYAQLAPTPQFRLAYKETTNGVNALMVRTPADGLDGKDKQFPHYTPGTAPACNK